MSRGNWAMMLFVCVSGVVGSAAAGGAMAAENKVAAEATVWQTSYAAAMETAEREHKPLALVFHQPSDRTLIEAIDSAVNADAALRYRIGQVILTSLPLDVEVSIQGKPTMLLSHPAYAALNQSAGLAIVDFRHAGGPDFGRTVGTAALEADDGHLSDRLVETLRQVTRAESTPLEWSTDYAEATEKARQEGRMLLVYFHDGAKQPCCLSFEEQTLGDPNIVARLQDYVLARLPLDVCVASDDGEVPLIRHPAFREMQDQPGLAIVDYAHRELKSYGNVVSAFPFLGGRAYSTAEMAVILDLPPGTLTQRTMIYAVRTHPERPASTNGQFDPHLAEEAERHSRHQANIGVQGHHNWDSRFHHINATLPPGLLAAEVCAESWRGQGLLQAAIECVRCWRTSSGHWSRVRSPQRVFGYDMKQGNNGIWYATGIFGAFR
ncbi:MAG: hypothetical protein GXY83_23170 [Rhodopirellula sp.]|nr:hypothetical protein [Rhodopirellula sp.]